MFSALKIFKATTARSLKRRGYCKQNNNKNQGHQQANQQAKSKAGSWGGRYTYKNVFPSYLERVFEVERLSGRKSGFVLGFIACATGAVLYQYMDRTKLDVKKQIDTAIDRFGYDDDEVALRGFTYLEGIGKVQKSTFSGVTVNYDIESAFGPRAADLVSALIPLTSKERSPELIRKSLHFIYFLSKYCPEARTRLAEKHMSPLINILMTRTFENIEDDAWLLTAATSLLVVRDLSIVDKIPDPEFNVLIRYIEDAPDIENPMTQIGFGAIAERLDMDSGLVDLWPNTNENMIQRLVEHVYKEPTYTHQAGTSIFSILAVTGLSVGYIRARWFIDCMRMGLTYKQSLAYMRNIHTGWAILAMFLSDYLIYRTLPYLSPHSLSLDEKLIKESIRESEDSVIMKKIRIMNAHLQLLPVHNNISLLDLMPAVQTAVFSTFATYLLYRRHYMFLPLMVAYMVNHRKAKKLK